MALTSFTTNSTLAVKLWRKKLFVEMLKATYFSKFVGKTPDSLIQFVTETQKSKGDRITVGLRMQLTGDGIQGDGTLEGNEEALTIYSDNITIDQLRHAVRSSGKMSEQRVPFEVREEAMAGLRDWWSDRLDTSFFNQIAGNTAQTDTRYTGNQAAIAPDASHQFWPNAVTNDQGLGTTDTMSLTLIDKAVNKAKTLTPAIRSIKINGEDKWAMFLHPNQVYSLRTNTNTGQWLDIQKAAATGGNVSKNPIYTGALGEYNGVVLHEAVRVPLGVNSSTGAAVANTRRAILCGAQSALFAVGQDGGPDKMTWVEELFDFENQLGVSAGMIFGLKKAVFNSADFGTVVASTYAATP